MTWRVQELAEALEGPFPSVLSTRGEDGLPNVSYMSQILVVNATHIAISDQFFRKTVANLHRDPRASLLAIRPSDGAQFRLRLRFETRLTDGEVFERLDAKITAIASMVGMSDVFKLRSAALFQLLDIERVPIEDST